MAKLIISQDGQVLRTVALNKERVSIGRHQHNDIVLEHPTVSGEHAVIATILDDSYLEDLNSTNGSFVNGHRVGRHFLRHQDQIRLAKYQIEFIADGVRPSGLAAGEGPLGTIRVMNGQNAGKELALSKPQTTLGRRGVQVVVISRHADGYSLQHVEGDTAPLLNGAALGKQAQALRHGDQIDLTGTQMTFTLA